MTCYCRDGFSLASLYRKMQPVDSVVLLVIKDVDEVIFGGLLSEPPQVTDSFTGGLSPPHPPPSSCRHG